MLDGLIAGKFDFLHSEQWNTSGNHTRHTSHVTRHASHVTRHTSHITRHTFI